MNDRLSIAGAWEVGAASDLVIKKCSGVVIGSVAVADEKQTRRAIAAAERTASVMARLIAAEVARAAEVFTLAVEEMTNCQMVAIRRGG